MASGLHAGSILLYPGDTGPPGQSERDYVGLLSYLRNKIKPRKQVRKNNKLGRDRPLDRETLKRVVQWRSSRSNGEGGRSRWLEATGELGSDDVYVLLATPSEYPAIYDALRRNDRGALDQYVIESHHVPVLIQSLLASMARVKVPWTGDKEIETEASGEDREGCSDSRLLEPLDLRQAIVTQIEALYEMQFVQLSIKQAHDIERWKHVLVPQLLVALRGLSRNDQQGNAKHLLCRTLEVLSPENPLAAIHLALLTLEQEEYARAFEYSNMIPMDSEYSGLRSVLQGMALAGDRRFDEARDAYHKAILLGEKVSGTLGIARTYAEFETRHRCLEWINQASEYDKSHPEGIVARANWERLWGDSHKGLELLEQLPPQVRESKYVRSRRISALYTCRDFAAVIEEGRSLLLAPGKVPAYVPYLVASALYGCKDYAESKAVAERGLTFASTVQEHSFLCLLLRKIAVQENDKRSALRNSVRLCRGIPQRQSAWLWLAADLEWCGHSGLAKRFWERELDEKTMDWEELSSAVLLLTKSNRAARAAKCLMCLPLDYECEKWGKELSDEQLYYLASCVGAKVLGQIEGILDGDWRRSVEYVRVIRDYRPSSDFQWIVWYTTLGYMLGGIKNEQERSHWVTEWNVIEHERLNVSVRFVGCANVYQEWKRKGGKAELIQPVVSIMEEALRETVENSKPDALNLGVMRYAVELVARCVQPRGAYDLLLQVAEWFEEVQESERHVLCRGALAPCVFAIAEGGYFEVLPTYFEIVCQQWGLTKDRMDRLFLLQAAGCASLGSAATDELRDQSRTIIDHAVQMMTEERARTKNVAAIIAASVNIHLAWALWICRYRWGGEKELLQLTKRLIEEVETCSSFSVEYQEELVCTYIGCIALYAVVSGRLQEGDMFFSELERLYGTSDRLSKVMNFYRRLYREGKGKGKKELSGFVSPFDELYPGPAHLRWVNNNVALMMQQSGDRQHVIRNVFKETMGVLADGMKSGEMDEARASLVKWLDGFGANKA